MTKKICGNIVKSLPEELLSKILTHTASNSITDFANTQSSCKAFHEASNYKYIYRDVSMKNMGISSWSRSQQLFQKRCEDADNPEALYRKGIVDFLSGWNPESGLRCLNQAAINDHVEALYAYGIILICCGGELREQGLRIVKALDLDNSKEVNLRNMHSRTKEFLRTMWRNIKLAAPEGMNCNCDKNCPRTSVKQRWEPSHNFCTCYDSCFWYHEATLFCGIL